MFYLLIIFDVGKPRLHGPVYSYGEVREQVEHLTNGIIGFSGKNVKKVVTLMWLEEDFSDIDGLDYEKYCE